MITYHINRFIHSIIRENKLVHIMEFIIGKNSENNLILNDFTAEMKKFLSKENDQLFDDNRLKYLIFLDNFKSNIENIADLKDNSDIESNSLLFRLYEIPKKRNNLFTVFLIYYYIKNKNKVDIWWKEILRIIYMYFMIIIYRNRISKEVRENLLEIDKKKFFTTRELLSQKIKWLERRYKFINMKFIKNTLAIWLISIISVFSYIHYSPDLIKADINWVTNNWALGKVAFDSIMIGRVSDPILNSLKDIWYQNILLILVFALLIQSLKTSLSTVFFNNLLTKIFHFLWLIIKFISRMFFYVYDYITYKLETKFIFSVLDKVIKRQLIPWWVLLWLFGIIYSSIYYLVVFIYIYVISYVFNLNQYNIYIPVVSLIITLMVIYFNLQSDINNFKTFILEIENIIKDIFEKRQKSHSESV